MINKQVEPHIFIVMGGTGDLMQRKILPALYHLATKGPMKGKCLILGAARSSELNDISYRQLAKKALRGQGLLADIDDVWFDKCFHYHSIGDGKAENYAALLERVQNLEKEHNLPGNKVLYLALPPMAFPTTIEMLGEVGSNRGHGWTRLVVEKPFGRDLQSAEELNRLVHRHFDESQVYRIDHYLGKETVQNLLVFRFANPIFESLWNRDRVRSIQITMAEDIGIGNRAGYYDRSGALRDIVQNHLTQLMTLVAMEIPAAFDAESIHAEKIKVLRSIAPIEKDDVVLGQYAGGMIGVQEVPGYQEEQGVNAGSTTATFAALRLGIANWRWHGVPFYLRTGKRLPARLTQIVVNFHRPPVSVFDPLGRCDIHSNALNITLQPDEGFDLLFEMKGLGEPLNLKTQLLHFRYAEAFAPLPDAYETLLLDIVAGDKTLFVHGDEVEAAWRLYNPVIEGNLPVHQYEAGSWGPPESDLLIRKDKNHWSNP